MMAVYNTERTAYKRYRSHRRKGTGMTLTDSDGGLVFKVEVFG